MVARWRYWLIVNDLRSEVERLFLAGRGPMPIACSSRRRSNRVGPQATQSNRSFFAKAALRSGLNNSSYATDRQPFAVTSSVFYAMD